MKEDLAEEQGLTETLQRFLTAVPIALLGIASITLEHFNWITSFFGTLVIVILGLREFYQLASRNSEERPFVIPGLLCGSVLVIYFYSCFLQIHAQMGHELTPLSSFLVALFATPLPWVVIFLILTIMASALIQLFTRESHGVIYSLSTTLFGLVYTVFPFGCSFFLFTSEHGPFYVCLFLILPISTDVGGYFIGRTFGKHKTGFAVSPNKTYEGYLGGFVCTVFSGLLLLWSRNHILEGVIPISYNEIPFIALLITIASICGDLLESTFKRDVQVKNSSQSLPGHGGVLDLMDAMYWSLPIGCIYLFLRGFLEVPI